MDRHAPRPRREPVRAVPRQDSVGVPAFDYTLLSVKQLWAEQRIDVRFADTNALVLPGDWHVPFEPSVKQTYVSQRAITALWRAVRCPPVLHPFQWTPIMCSTRPSHRLSLPKGPGTVGSSSKG